MHNNFHVEKYSSKLFLFPARVFHFTLFALYKCLEHGFCTLYFILGLSQSKQKLEFFFFNKEASTENVYYYAPSCLLNLSNICKNGKCFYGKKSFIFLFIQKYDNIFSRNMFQNTTFLPKKYIFIHNFLLWTSSYSFLPFLASCRVVLNCGINSWMPPKRKNDFQS